MRSRTNSPVKKQTLGCKNIALPHFPFCLMNICSQVLILFSTVTSGSQSASESALSPPFAAARFA